MPVNWSGGKRHGRSRRTTSNPIFRSGMTDVELVRQAVRHYGSDAGRSSARVAGSAVSSSKNDNPNPDPTADVWMQMDITVADGGSTDTDMGAITAAAAVYGFYYAQRTVSGNRYCESGTFFCGHDGTNGEASAVVGWVLPASTFLGLGWSASIGLGELLLTLTDENSTGNDIEIHLEYRYALPF